MTSIIPIRSEDLRGFAPHRRQQRDKKLVNAEPATGINSFVSLAKSQAKTSRASSAMIRLNRSQRSEFEKTISDRRFAAKPTWFENGNRQRLTQCPDIVAVRSMAAVGAVAARLYSRVNVWCFVVPPILGIAALFLRTIAWKTGSADLDETRPCSLTIARANLRFALEATFHNRTFRELSP